VTLATRDLTRMRGPIDTLLVGGGDGTAQAIVDAALLQQVRRLSPHSRRVASVCSGAFVLAEAGLLDDLQATTHWAWTSTLAKLYPRVHVVPDAIYMREFRRHQEVWTSAGVTAGIDLALAMVADDHGTAMATEVARQLVVYVRRGGGQSQYSTHLAAQGADPDAGAHAAQVDALLVWIRDHLDGDLSVPALASRMHLSPRQFVRVFQRATGRSPGGHVEAVRVEAAQRLLATTTLPIAAVSRQTGFGSADTFHRVFRRQCHVTPSDYRTHFGQIGNA
jgi:transcriptional regulator GlxA family with amidase domain